MKKITRVAITFALLFTVSPLFSQVVTSGADDGSDGTLRQEIMDTPAGGEVTFAITVLNVDLNSELVIDKELTISGNPILTTTIDGNDNGRIFNITAGPVTLNDLIVTNGTAEDGGGIYVTNAEVTINECTISDNVADGASGSGGGIFNDVGGSLIIDGSTLSGNQANRAGGAIEDNSDAGLNITITDTDIENNNAGVAPATAAPGNGGGIHITGAGDISITGGSVNENIAALEGGGLWNGGGTMTVDNVEIDGNTASGDAADDGGGGIFNNGGTLMISNGTEITNNVADGAAGSGGGILNLEGSLTVEDSEISNNTSVRAGGGIEEASTEDSMLTLTNVDFDGNETASSPGNGGALHITGAGDSMITGGSVTNNIASSEGGGLWNGSGMMTIDGTTIDGNTASGDAADNGGGGVFNNGGSLMIMNETIITNNIADGTSGSGGGILNFEGSLTVENSEISGNSAVRAGGGIEEASVEDSMLLLTNVDFDSNSVSANPGNGGALHITGPGDSNITGGSVTNNTASAEGGGLWNNAGVMTIDGVTIDSNVAEGDDADTGGGGVFNNGGTLNILNETIISNNTATGESGSGGGLLSTDGDVTIENTSFDTNGANRAGGAIEIIDGTLMMTDSEMNANEVSELAGTANPGNGGAIHITGMSGQIDLIRVDVTANIAANEGGGLWNQSGSTMNIMESTIDANIANGDGGGGIYNNGGTTTIEQTTISANSATSNDGGGILNDTGSLSLMRSTVSGNDAALNGGGIYNNDDMDINAATIALNVTTGEGGGIFAASEASVKNTIVAANTAANGQDVAGNFASNGYNLIGTDDDDAFPADGTDIEGSTPDLGPLQDNGGETFTHELLEGSDGIDAGDPADMFLDQRGFSIEGPRDIGAYEQGGILGIDDIISGEALTVVYPNPADDRLSIAIADDAVGNIELKIISISGQVVMTKTLSPGVNEFNLYGIQSGMYITRIQVGDTVSSHKLVVQ